jgi:soluble P-type ATPase
MLDIAIPGFKVLRLQHLVLDYNGTLAVDGVLLDGVKERLLALSGILTIHVLTADTFGKARSGLAGLPCKLSILPADHQDRAKLAYVEQLGAAHTVCIGNGRNDRLMLGAAALGIAVPQREGMAVEAMLAADVVTPDILHALDLLKQRLRLVATLRS